MEVGWRVSGSAQTSNLNLRIFRKIDFESEFGLCAGNCGGGEGKQNK